MIDPYDRNAFSPIQHVALLFRQLTLTGAGIVAFAVMLALLAGPGASLMMGEPGGRDPGAVGALFEGLLWVLRFPVPLLLTVAGAVLPIFALARYRNEMLHPGIRLRPSQARGMMPVSTACVLVGAEEVALLALAFFIIL